jgi:hypothetical protein
MPIVTTNNPDTRSPGEGFNIENFYARIEQFQGLQKTSKFMVRIFPPALMAGDTILSMTSRMLEFWCMATPLPGYTVGTHDILRYSYGPVEKKPFTPIFTDLTLVFLGDAQGIIKKYFDTWQTCIINKDNRWGDIKGEGSTITAKGAGSTRLDPFEISYKSDYETVVEIITFNDAGEKSSVYVLQEAYPIMVSDIQLNWGEMNNIMAVPVTFTFFSWFNQDLSMSIR